MSTRSTLAVGGRTRRTTTTHLTRRGRIVVVLAALVLLVVGFSMGQVSSQAAGPGHAQRPPTVTVQTGETLWQLAARIAPHADPRLVVAQIEQLNHLRSPELLAGQQLTVPRYH